MSLNERMQKVTKIGRKGAVVEFDNGFGVAYELRPKTVKQVILDEGGIVKDSREVEANSLSYRVLGPSVSLGISRGFGPDREGDFSRGFEKALQKPITACQKRHAELEKTIESCYDSMVAPLQIEEFRERQWKEYALNLAAYAGMTAIWPIAVPTMIVASYFRQPSHAGSTLGLAMMLAPLCLPQAIYHTVADIISPKKTAYRVRNRKALSQESGEDCAALVFKYNERGTPKCFDSYSVVLPEGVSFWDGTKRERRGNTIFMGEGREVYAHREKFNDFDNAKWFFKVDRDVKTQACLAVDERDSLVERFYEFERSITKEDHYAVVRAAGILAHK